MYGSPECHWNGIFYDFGNLAVGELSKTCLLTSPNCSQVYEKHMCIMCTPTSDHHFEAKLVHT